MRPADARQARRDAPCWATPRRREDGSGPKALQEAVQRWDGPARRLVSSPADGWQIEAMRPVTLPLHRTLVDSLYTEAMVLADEARSYFDRNGREERDALSPLERVGFTCESLKVTTKLMHIIAWLLTRRAVDAGEISAAQAASPERRLGRGQVMDAEVVAGLPEAARHIIHETAHLYARIERLDRDMAQPAPAISPGADAAPPRRFLTARRPCRSSGSIRVPPPPARSRRRSSGPARRASRSAPCRPPP